VRRAKDIKIVDPIKAILPTLILENNEAMKWMKISTSEEIRNTSPKSISGCIFIISSPLSVTH